MYPRHLDFVRATSAGEAIGVLVENPDARVIAGGQSLVPMLSLGLASPSCLVDINGLDLDGVERANGSVRIGALTRHREFERSHELRGLLPLATEAARHIGNPRVRNRGTVGGSLSHADPAAELCAVALAHGGRVVLAGPSGQRFVTFEDFLLGYFETAAQSDEILIHAELDVPPAGSGTAFVEVGNRADDFATAGAAAIVSVGADATTCVGARVVVFGTGGAPSRLRSAEELCAGEVVTDTLLDRVVEVVAELTQAEDDPFTSAAHRVRCACACTKRAISLGYRRARAS